jgi:hypothetical protein
VHGARPVQRVPDLACSGRGIRRQLVRIPKRAALRLSSGVAGLGRQDSGSPKGRTMRAVPRAPRPARVKNLKSHTYLAILKLKML